MKKWLLCLLALSLCLCPLFVGCDNDEDTQQPAFVPPPFDTAAVNGAPEVPDGLGYRVMDAKGVYSFGVCGELKLNGAATDVWFTSPETNTVWLKLRVMDTAGNILGETGLIKPGQYVQTVALQGDCTVGMAVTVKIMSYAPETYYSRGEVTVNTQFF